MEHKKTAVITGASSGLGAAMAAEFRRNGFHVVALCRKAPAQGLADEFIAADLTDPEELRWSSPASQAVQDYLVALMVELAQLGFDEILLDNAGYPVDGNLDYIVRNDAYDSALFPATVRGFYTDLVQRLEEQYPEVVLSVVTDRDTLEAATSEESGQTLSGMAERMDRIWVRDLGAAWTQCVQLLDEAGLSRPEVNLVSIDTQAGVSDRSWCLWP